MEMEDGTFIAGLLDRVAVITPTDLLDADGNSLYDSGFILGMRNLFLYGTKTMERHLRAFVRDRVDTRKAALITDEYPGYRGMAKVLPHAVIKHADWYVDGDIHTNTIEGFWALLKRGMFGQFHSVSRRHLQRYIDEFCYRYNLRNADPLAAFDLTINRGLGVAR